MSDLSALIPKTLDQWHAYEQPLAAMPKDQMRMVGRYLARHSLWYLLRYVLNRRDMEHPWVFARVTEVQASPNGHLDLWSREHFKSSIITQGLTIYDILRTHGDDPVAGPEATFGIFSHSRPIAKAFLKQIKRDLETNPALKWLFPDILWANPRAESPQWSDDDGLIVKRKGNPKEATIEAWGLVDGQPTSKHFNHLVYDDVVTRDSVTTPEMVSKTTDAWALSTNLGTLNGVIRYAGTRYANADTYQAIMDRGAAKPRIYPATCDGTFNGKPVMWTQEVFEQKVTSMLGVAAAQLLQDPRQGLTTLLRRSDLRFYREVPTGAGKNVYLLVDPANSKKRGSDCTAMGVIGLGADSNYYLLDAVYDHLGLAERTEALLDLHKKWRPISVGYEQYGAQADIEHIQDVQARINYRFDIIPLGGRLSKRERVDRLIPDLRANRWYWPVSLHCADWQGKHFDLIEAVLTQEYDLWPFPQHDDFLDMLSRIYEADLCVAWPRLAVVKKDRYAGAVKTRTWRSM